MIYVTVGTMYLDFARLLRAMDQIAADSGEEVIAQIGHSTYRPTHCDHFDFKPRGELLALQGRARVIVAHAGIGCVLDALSTGRPLIVVPRLRAHGEHNTDHQCELADAVARRGWGRQVRDVGELAKACANPPAPFAGYRPDRERLIEAVRTYVAGAGAASPTNPSSLSSAPRISVVVPAYNAAATIAACLAGCQAQRLPAHEIIVVDDGSTDATATLAADAPGVRVLAQENAGPAAARNRGADAATGAWVAFTDSDCVPDPGWLEALAACMDDATVAVGGTYGIANPGHWLARGVHAEIQSRHARIFEGQPVDFLGSFNVAYRREAIVGAGGFDTRFAAASGEDNDLAYRLADHGGLLRFSHFARVAHHHPTRVGAYLRTQARHGYWRALLYRIHFRRGRGDNYAGPADLALPPLFLGAALCAAMVPTAHALGWTTVRDVAAALALAAVCLYVLAAALAPRAAGQGLDLPAALGFAAVRVLRDCARGLGLARGIWDFWIRRKGDR